MTLLSCTFTVDSCVMFVYTVGVILSIVTDSQYITSLPDMAVLSVTVTFVESAFLFGQISSPIVTEFVTWIGTQTFTSS